jgi:hypothetical protein
VIEFTEVRRLGEALLSVLNREGGPSLGCDRASLEWLDGYIERNRPVFSEDRRRHGAVAFGYVLGEAIIRAFGVRLGVQPALRGVDGGRGAVALHREPNW